MADTTQINTFDSNKYEVYFHFYFGDRELLIREWVEVMFIEYDAILRNQTLKASGLLAYINDPSPQTIHSITTAPEELLEDDVSSYPTMEPTNSTLDDLIYSANIHSDVPDRNSILKILLEYKELFLPTLASEGINADPMPIHLKSNAVLKKQYPRKTTPEYQQFIDEQVKLLLDMGVITEAIGERESSPVVIAKNPKSNKLRMCIDYRHLNTITEDYAGTLPHIPTLISKLAGKRYHATLDMTKGYHQLWIVPEDNELTTFSTLKGVYKWLRVPFGLKNAPKYFQRALRSILGEYDGTICVLFIDDIDIFGDTWDGFLTNLRKVLRRLWESNVRLGISKCTFGKSQVEYLGCIIDANGHKLDPKRIQPIIEFERPKNIKAVKRFLGMINQFRDYIEHFAMIVKPIISLTSSKTTYVWSDECDRAFNEIKFRISRSEILHHIDYNKPIIVRPDACSIGIGATLFNWDVADNKEHYVLFISHILSPQAQKWSPIELEAFAIYYAVVLKLSHILLGHKFYLETDHKNLLWWEKATAPKLVRWWLRYSEFDAIPIHIPGSQNVIADALSRQSCSLMKDTSFNNDISFEEKYNRFKSVHNPYIGHFGVEETTRMLNEQQLNWPGIVKDVKEFCQSCPTCQKCRLGQGSFDAAIRPIHVEEPFSNIGADFIGPLPEDEQGNRYILALICLFSRFVLLYPTKSNTAKEVANCILQLIGTFGLPQVIRSDMGSHFTADVVNHLLKLLNINHQYSIPYHPQAMGNNERYNQEVMRHLRAIVFDYRIKQCWSIYLPIVQKITNCAYHSAIGTSPHRIIFGDSINLNRSFFTTRNTSDILTYEDYVQRLHNQIDVIVQASQRYLSQVMNQRKSKGPETSTTFNEGDYVLISYPTGRPNKLHYIYKGPYIIVERKGDAYICQDLNTLVVLTPVHGSRLKVYKPPPFSTNRSLIDIASRDNDEHIVESIITHHGNPRHTDPTKYKDVIEFLVRWQDCEPSEDEWLYYRDIKNCEALDVYIQQHPELSTLNISKGK